MLAVPLAAVAPHSTPTCSLAAGKAVESGGTAGDIDWVVYVSSPGGYRLSLVPGGCCPSGGFVHTRWHWNGERFAVVRTWHDRRYQE